CSMARSEGEKEVESECPFESATVRSSRRLGWRRKETNLLRRPRIPGASGGGLLGSSPCSAFSSPGALAGMSVEGAFSLLIDPGRSNSHDTDRGRSGAPECALRAPPSVRPPRLPGDHIPKDAAGHEQSSAKDG